ncbi:hypothetical protein ABTQ33_01985 [Paucilactobacillus suebicus]|uniref:hypothetical protein n=1 Tax=Paucilactobacillus suebicus TaxID=152335 RepID=UPI0002490877|nr:hypothetical protein [Paucilactobacillus suebicus]
MDKGQNLYWAYAAFIEIPGGKTRPVLYVRQTETDYIVYRLTSKYKNKSPKIKAKYVEIGDWQKVGLPKKSWIDLIKTYSLPINSTKLTFIGSLTEEDSQNIIRYLNKFDE